MKHLTKPIALAISLFAASQFYSQSGIHSSYGTAIGTEGSVHYSVGQVFHSTTTSAEGEVSEGVQKAFEIYVVGLGEGPILIDAEITPNPTQGILTLSSSEAVSREMSYAIYNKNGQLLEAKEFLQGTIQIDLSTFQTGLYFIHVSNDLMGEKVFKIIKTQ